jgi:hypothetical protein
MQTPMARPVWARLIKAILLRLLWLAIALLSLWLIAALYVDIRTPTLRIPVVVFFIAAKVAIVSMQRRLAPAFCFACCCCVLVWWLNLQPSNQADWRPDVSRTAWIEILGDRVTIHNFRNCDYRAETSYTDCWTEKTVYLSQLNRA